MLAGRLLLFPLWWASGLVPRRGDLWVFGSWGGHRFADNAAGFFMFCRAALHDRVELVWISRDRDIVARMRRAGHDARLAWSPGGMLACLRAGLHLFDCFPKDTNFWLSRGAVKVNLWSGVPLKVFEREIDNPASRYYRLFHGTAPERWLLTIMMPWHVERPDLVIATSEETAAIICRAFDLPAQRVVVTGLPRNDVMLATDSPGTAELPAEFATALAAGETLFIYLPTYRDSDHPYHRTLDWVALDALLARHHARLFYKVHPMAQTPLAIRLERIVALPRDLDVYPLLRHTRALVSDYSSVIFDYMLLGRPIVYFTPDLDDFVGSSRRLNYRPADVAVGPLCADSAQLLHALERIARGEDPAGPQRRDDVLTRLHAHVDAGSSRRVLEAIERRYPGAPLRQRQRALEEAAGSAG
jgi:CDP-glycerol glycerophosphotransferase (TagB/SpsB family)